MATLTGRTRHRDGLFGKLILQVEEQWISGGPGRPQPGKDFHQVTWRDAKMADLYALKELEARSPVIVNYHRTSELAAGAVEGMLKREAARA